MTTERKAFLYDTLLDWIFEQESGDNLVAVLKWCNLNDEEIQDEISKR